MITTKRKKGEFIISITDNIGIGDTEEFKKIILEGIKDSKEIKIVTSKNITIHLSIIQIILAAKNLCESKNKEFEISDNSTSLNYLFDELGIVSNTLCAIN